MTDKITVKKVGIEAFEDFYSLYKKTLDQGYFLYPPKSTETFEMDVSKEESLNNIKTGRKILFLGYVNEKLAGYLLTNRLNGGVSFGHWLAVDKVFQKRGVATKLLEFWENDAIKQGSHALELFTTKNDVEFYVNRGFLLIGEFPDAWYGVDHFHFYKKLRKSDESRFLKSYFKEVKVK